MHACNRLPTRLQPARAARLPARSAAYADAEGCEFLSSHLIFPSLFKDTSFSAKGKVTQNSILSRLAPFYQAVSNAILHFLKWAPGALPGGRTCCERSHPVSPQSYCRWHSAVFAAREAAGPPLPSPAGLPASPTAREPLVCDFFEHYGSAFNASCACGA